MTLYHAIQTYLLTCRELNNFCTQNGWIDNETLSFDIIEQTDDYTIVSLQFKEIIMEGAGCIASPVACFGKLKLFFDETGQVKSAIDL
jgi:hypothetical protein